MFPYSLQKIVMKCVQHHVFVERSTVLLRKTTVPLKPGSKPLSVTTVPHWEFTKGQRTLQYGSRRRT